MSGHRKHPTDRSGHLLRSRPSPDRHQDLLKNLLAYTSHYGEGIFVGYRYYDKKNLAPLFPFGHGLSYTTFKYSNLRLSAKSMTPAQTLKVKVDITNTGKVAGQEVAQLYVRDVKATFARPEKELKGFQKVELKPGQTRTLTFALDREAFWYFDEVKNAWSTEAGEFEILVGASSRDIRLSGMVTLEPDPRGARFHTGLTVRALLDHPESRAVVTKYAGGFLLMEDMSMAMDMTLELLKIRYDFDERLLRIQNCVTLRVDHACLDPHLSMG